MPDTHVVVGAYLSTVRWMISTSSSSSSLTLSGRTHMDIVNLVTDQCTDIDGLSTLFDWPGRRYTEKSESMTEM